VDQSHDFLGGRLTGQNRNLSAVADAKSGRDVFGVLKGDILRIEKCNQSLAVSEIFRPVTVDSSNGNSVSPPSVALVFSVGRSSPVVCEMSYLVICARHGLPTCSTAWRGWTPR
jgi:hypothetical protein